MADTLDIATCGPALVDITRRVSDIVSRASAPEGVAHIFIQHTSASLLIQENADPDVCADLIDWFSRTAPESTQYRHSSEGPDDMPAHIKAALTNVSLTVPFADRRMLLGMWQGIYLFEHRRGAHQRRVIVTLTPSL